MDVESERSGSSTRNRLRQAAVELFGERGFDGTSMADLAERVGIAKPSLYNYYRSKEELLIDLLEDAIARFLEECLPPLLRASSLEEALGEYLLRVARFARAHPHELVLYQLARIHLAGDVATRARARLRTAEQEVRMAMGRCLGKAVESGELPPQEVELLQDFIRVFVHGLVFLHFPAAQEECCFEQPVERLWPLLFRAIAGRLPAEGSTG